MVASIYAYGAKAKAYVESGCVYAFGSDLHEVDKKAYREFTSIKKKVGPDNFEMVMNRSAELLAPPIGREASE